MPEFTDKLKLLGDQFRERAQIIKMGSVALPTNKEVLAEIYVALGALSDALEKKTNRSS